MAEENAEMPQEEFTQPIDEVSQEPMDEQTEAIPAVEDVQQQEVADAPTDAPEESLQGPSTDGAGDGAADSGSAEEKSHPDDDDKKLFVGNLNWETPEAEIQKYFEQFGTVVECTLKKDVEGNSRGFGFITFDTTEAREKVLNQKEPHMLGGREIDPKPANPRHQKVFVGGLCTTLSEDDIRKHFEQYGEIEKLDLPTQNGQRKAFAFITYKHEASVAKAIAEPRKTLGMRECEVKKAAPNQKSQFGARGGMRGRGRGAAWSGYGQGNYGYGGYGSYPGYSSYGSYPGYGGGYGGYDFQWGDYGQGYYPPYSGYDYWSQGYDQQQQSSNYGKAQRGGRGNFHPYQR